MLRLHSADAVLAALQVPREDSLDCVQQCAVSLAVGTRKHTPLESRPSMHYYCRWILFWESASYKGMVSVRVGCVLMQKNEGLALVSWLSYHGELVGYENIYVIDNGSDDNFTKEVLFEYKDKGVNIDYQFDKQDHFRIQGELVANKIKEVDSGIDKCDVYFPIDCDEYLTVMNNERVPTTNKTKIKDSLRNFIDFKGVCIVGLCFDNSPIHKDYYLPAPGQRKCFFPSGACVSLDNGFHSGTGRNGLEVTTNLSYIHFHYRKYEEYIKLCKDKLKPYINDFSKTNLYHYVGDGSHCAQALLQTEYEYYRNFSKKGRLFLPEILTTIRARETHGRFCRGSALSGLESIFANRDAARKTIAAPKGFVDVIEARDNHLRVAGWAAMPNGAKVGAITLMIDGREIPVDNLVRVRRPDVVKSKNSRHNYCGFDALVNFNVLPEDASSLTVFASDRRGRAQDELIIGDPNIDWQLINRRRNQAINGS